MGSATSFQCGSSRRREPISLCAASEGWEGVGDTNTHKERETALRDPYPWAPTHPSCPLHNRRHIFKAEPAPSFSPKRQARPVIGEPVALLSVLGCAMTCLPPCLPWRPAAAATMSGDGRVAAACAGLAVALLHGRQRRTPATAQPSMPRAPGQGQAAAAASQSPARSRLLASAPTNWNAGRAGSGPPAG